MSDSYRRTPEGMLDDFSERIRGLEQRLALQAPIPDPPDPYVPGPGKEADVGDVKMTALSAASAGWLLCDGAAVSRTTYAALFTAIGTTYGIGDNSTTFNVPDLRGRAPVGRDSGQTEFDTLGEAGGAKTHTLIESEIPAHAHGPAGASSFLAGGGGAGANVTTGGGGYGTIGTTDTTGGDGAHNNLQPYRVLNFVIKT